MIEVACIVCGGSFRVKPLRFRRKYPPQFCSRACFYQGRRNVGMTGKRHTEEERRRMSERMKARMAQGHPMEGRKQTPESRAKMSRSQCLQRHGTEVPLTETELRAARNAYYRERNKIPRWNLANRLKASLQRALRLCDTSGTFRGGAFRHLPYTRAEFAAYMQGRLDACNWSCPMCAKSLRDGFDVDHIIPVVTAETVEDVLRLYALENLQPLCPRCNRNVKKGRILKVA